MAGRPTRHAIGDRAVLAVQGLLAAAGYASEPLLNDYGEDLLVQLTFTGDILPCRLWIQVKGTAAIDRYMRSWGGPSYPFARSHLVRWGHSAEPVLLVLWDVERETGWYAFARNRRDAVHGSRTLAVRFESDALLTVDAMRSIADGERLRHLRRLLLEAADMRVDADMGEETDAKAAEEADVLAVTYGLDLVELLGMVSRSEPDDAGDERWEVAPAAIGTVMAEFEMTEGDEDFEIRVLGASLLAVLDMGTRKFGGLTRVLIERGGLVLSTMVMSYVREETERS
jgi:hypothetical protein